MTEQKKLDMVREKMKQIINDNLNMKSPSCPDGDYYPLFEDADLYRPTNKILSLIEPLIEEAKRDKAKEKDTWWHDNIQRVKKLIKEGKDPQEQRDINVAHDEWHPELALLWEIAIEMSRYLKGGGE